MTGAGDPLPEDVLDWHAEEGWRFASECLERLELDQELDTVELQAAIDHLRVAVLYGVDGLVLRDPLLLDLLGMLLLQVPEGDAKVTDEAHEAFATGLDCPDLDDSQRLSLLAGVLEACFLRLGSVHSAAGDVYDSSSVLAAARDELVHAARNLFLAVPPEHEWAGATAAALIRALALRLIGGTEHEDDSTELRRLIQMRSDMRTTEGIEGAASLVLVACQALMIAFEHHGREELLVAVADLADEATGWLDLPSAAAPLISSMLASSIVNAPADGELAARLPEARALLDDVLTRLSPDDPQTLNVKAQRAILLRRLAAAGGSDKALAEAAVEIERTVRLLPQADAREGAGKSTRSMLVGLLATVLDARFQMRQDLRDARTGLHMTERALAEFHGSDLQRTMLLGNRAIGLLRLAWSDRSPDTATRAEAAAREALGAAPPATPLHVQLHGILAAALLVRSQAEGPAQQVDTLRQAWAAAEVGATEDPPNPQTLVIQLAVAQLLGMRDVEVQRSAGAVRERLAKARTYHAAAGRSTESLDVVTSAFDALAAHLPEASAEAIDAALGATETQLAGLEDVQLAFQLLAMQRARLLRHRDNLRWREFLAQFQNRSVTPDVTPDRLQEWLERGGSDIAQIRELATKGVVRSLQNRPDRRRSREAGLRVLHGHAQRVLLQAGTEDAVVTAQAASSDSHEVVTWCLADGADDEAITALEMGRGLTLLAAGAAGSIASQLEAVGEAELAHAWRAGRAAAGSGVDTPGDLRVPDDIRHRVLDRLSVAGDLADLLRPPDRAAIAGTLGELGYDALLYLVPGGRSRQVDLVSRTVSGKAWHGGHPRPGGALIVTAGGHLRWHELPELAVGLETPVDEYLRAHHALIGVDGGTEHRDAWRGALESICGWAWKAAIGPLTPTLSRIHHDRRARVVLVPVDALCVVPWHAAYPPGDASLPASERRYALETVTYSYAASGGLLTRTARRERPELDSAALLVGDPGGDLPFAQVETQALRDAFYPDAAVWGEPPELTDAAATPARICQRLDGSPCSLLHYAGHATVDPLRPGSSALMLGDQRLRAEAISRLAPSTGYLVCLAACTTHMTTRAFDEVFTLSTAFLLGGATTVIGSLWRLKDSGTAVLMFMIHYYLHCGMRPVDAVRRAQTWMLDEGRRLPASMPTALKHAADHVDLADPVIWAGIVHQGW
jgi:CHAT domain